MSYILTSSVRTDFTKSCYPQMFLQSDLLAYAHEFNQTYIGPWSGSKI